jgi:hypothetical protein
MLHRNLEQRQEDMRHRMIKSEAPQVRLEKECLEKRIVLSDGTVAHKRKGYPYLYDDRGWPILPEVRICRETSHRFLGRRSALYLSHGEWRWFTLCECHWDTGGWKSSFENWITSKTKIRYLSLEDGRDFLSQRYGDDTTDISRRLKQPSGPNRYVYISLRTLIAITRHKHRREGWDRLNICAQCQRWLSELDIYRFSKSLIIEHQRRYFCDIDCLHDYLENHPQYQEEKIWIRIAKQKLFTVRHWLKKPQEVYPSQSKESTQAMSSQTS